MTTLATLPVGLTNHIMQYLVSDTVTREVANEADLPYVLKYVSNLGLTCKALDQKIASFAGTKALLGALSTKFGETPEYFAGVLNTRAARRWMYVHLQTNGDKETYRSLRDIHKTALEIHKVINTLSPQNCTTIHFEYIGERNSVIIRPIFFVVDWAGITLRTRFGAIKLMEFHGCSRDTRLLYLEQLIHRSNAVFDSVGGSCSMGGYQARIFSAYTLCRKTTPQVVNINPSETKNLDPDQLAEYKHKPTAALPTISGDYAAYKILKDQAVLDVQIVNRGERALKMIWEMLECEYEGGNALTKEINISYLDPHRPYRKKLERAPNPIYRSLDDVLRYFTINGNEDAHRMYQLMGEGASALSSKNPKFKEDKQIDRKILSYAVKNWEKASYKDYPNVLQTESEEEFTLFIKRERLFRDEYILLRCLANLMGIRDYFSCHADWRKVHHGEEDKLPLYVWIHNSKIQEIRDLFDFDAKLKIF